MPVRFTQGGDHHDRGDYSFYTRDHGSRDFARTRRFGGDEPEDGRTMSLVSSPLQVPLIGRRSVSPQRSTAQSQQQLRLDNEEDFEEEYKNIQQRRRQSVENRRKIEQNTYDEFEDEPLEPLVPTFQPRFSRLSQRSSEPRHASPSPRRSFRRQQQQFDEYQDQVPEEEPFYENRRDDFSQQSRRQQREDEELQSMLNWRKRTKTQEPLVHTDFGYEVPPMRKRTDPALQAEEESIRSVQGYLAKRKQFAVEDDEDMQYYRNPNYQYRTRGMERPMVITDRDVEESLERQKLDRAPVFDMKLRSHVVWEKMNVKFTCTVRGSPKPRVTWYKDMVPLEPSLRSPGKFKISNQYGLHTLEICRASIEDSGTYRVSMQNRKGEMSSYATLLVRRYDGGRMGVMDIKSGYNMRKPTDYPDVEGLNVPEKRPQAGTIEVREYDALPETDAARYFKSQVENLDFDVKKLIKEAKLEKEIEINDQAIGKKEATSQVTYKDSVTIDPKDPTGCDLTLDATTKISNASAQISGVEERNGGVLGVGVVKSEMSEINLDAQDHTTGKKSGIYKVALKVNVKNETRRDSLDTIEKTLQIERKREAEKKKEAEIATDKSE